LATVYGVVKQSGGFIWVISSPGQGTTFEIYLPQVSEPVSRREVEAKPAIIPDGNETILVVEDEAGVRELACQFLRVKGYTVLEAQDGEEALKIAARHSGTIHLLLSDMVMPKMNGANLAGKLKIVCPDMRIAFMSGYSEFSRGDMGQALSDAPVLQKPFSPASLVGIVREALAEPSPSRPGQTKESGSKESLTSP
jgi:two-component system, cell cycle sensor histidine kinase and response regulator CckA